MTTIRLEETQYDCNKQPLMYGDRVRFHWVDELYENNVDLVCGGEYDLEGLYSGKYEGPSGAELANVTVTTKGEFYKKVISLYPNQIEIINHKNTENMEKKQSEKIRNYDIISLMQMCDKIMDEFDFARVADVMRSLNWTWASEDPSEDMSVPDEKRIRREARSLMYQVINSIGTNDEIHIISTGGFTVTFEDYEGIPNLKLQFTIEEWEEGYDFWDEYEKGVNDRKNEGYPMLKYVEQIEK